MNATLLAKTRIVYSQRAFAELVLWQLPIAAIGSAHPYKYRLAYVVDGKCVIRYDNEVGKGDHCHHGFVQTPYRFTTPKQLIADFQLDIARWNNENGHT
jgi:hypothetical protein